MSGARITQDVALLAAIHAEGFDKPWSEAEFAKLLANPAAFALVDHDEAGMVLSWAAAGDSELLTIAVKPASRRAGLGAGLVQAAMAHALVRGAHAMILEVSVDNAPARALYERLGFEEIGRRRDYYLTSAGRSDALVLRRALG